MVMLVLNVVLVYGIVTVMTLVVVVNTGNPSSLGLSLMNYPVFGGFIAITLFRKHMIGEPEPLPGEGMSIHSKVYILAILILAVLSTPFF